MNKPNRFMESLRGTGRTSRMVEAAKDLAKDGKPVVIVVHSDIFKQDMVRKFDLRCGSDWVGGRVNVVSMHSHDFDWHKFTLHGVQPERVFIDHWVIESRYAQIVELLHRFDEPK